MNIAMGKKTDWMNIYIPIPYSIENIGHYYSYMYPNNAKIYGKNGTNSNNIITNKLSFILIIIEIIKLNYFFDTYFCHVKIGLSISFCLNLILV